MLTRVLPIALLVVFTLEFQAVANAQASQAQESTMLRPPPVSVQSYRAETGMQERSNYLRGGVTAGVGYIDNLYAGTSQGQGELGETIINLQPSIAFDAKSARQHTLALYSPSFIFYEPTSGLNEDDHNLSITFEYRFSPRLTMDLNESLLKSSSGFGQIGNGGISGSAPTTVPAIISPFGERFTNDATGGLSYQFSERGMIGGSGNVGNLDYPQKSSQIPGLYNSDSRGGSGFYAYRLSGSQYFGAIGQYEQVLAYPTGPQYDTQTQTISGFYTIFPTKTLSLSVSGGPQHYTESHAPFPTTQAWTPAVTASMGWQNNHTSFAANFSRTVTGGGGLLGAFDSKGFGASGIWQISRLWTAGVICGYSTNKNETPLSGASNQGGHSFVTSVNAGRILSAHSSVALRYDRIQNRYDGVQAVDVNPSSDRVMLSYTWQFLRPVGR